jgi:hypothetical protein
MPMDEFEAKYGSDPAIIRMLAKIGAELSEDSPPSGGTGGEEADLHALMAHAGYFDANHPEHQRLKLQVRAIMERKHGTGPHRNVVPG